MIDGFRKSIAAKISVLVVAMVLLCSIALGTASVLLYRRDTENASAKRAMDIAQTVASSINGEEFVRIMNELEEDDYWQAAKTTLDETMKRTGVAYLYVLDAHYSEYTTYFAEGFNPGVSIMPEYGLGDEEALVEDGEEIYAEEMFAVMKDGTPRTTDVYNSGDYGRMVSGFAAITDQNGKVVGVVGTDVMVDEVAVATMAFTLQMVLIVAVFCLLLGFLSVWFMRRYIGRPLNELTTAADKLAEGDTAVHIKTGRTDEVGELANSFEKIATGTREQARILQKFAEGDLSVKVSPRGKEDTMNIAIQDMLAKLNVMFGEIKETTLRVSMASQQISQVAETLASGSTEQAGTIEEFSATVSEVMRQSQQSANQAQIASEGAVQAGKLMGESLTSMEQMEKAMQDIDESSKAIKKVIKVIDDIAFQTNILALNAAVEAAGAGQYGKGFAVVAEEVRNLANKSAAAARETTQLIANSVQKVQEGGVIVDKTRDGLQEIADISKQNSESMEEIRTSSGKQSLSISEITVGMQQISTVVHSNSATAEESAAAAQEMARQAQVLEDIVSRFKLK